MASRDMADLIALVADIDAENALRGIFSRPQSLGIRPITERIDRHVQRDSGCYRNAPEYLRPFVGQFRRALVVFDQHGCGHDEVPRDQLEADVEERLARNGWADRAAVIVVAPELEAWVWSDSPIVARVLGWRGEMRRLQEWLQSNGLLGAGRGKPLDPKVCFLRALRQARRGYSAILFRRLAEQVSLERCTDPAFLKLKETLRHWFPAA